MASPVKAQAWPARSIVVVGSPGEAIGPQAGEINVLRPSSLAFAFTFDAGPEGCQASPSILEAARQNLRRVSVQTPSPARKARKGPQTAARAAAEASSG